MRKAKIDRKNTAKYKWLIKKSKKLVKNKYLDLREYDITRSDKSKGKYYVVHRKDYVCIVPFDGKHFWLVGQYRITMKAYSWEFVQGGTEEDERLITAAKRELLEETGFKAKKWTPLGRFHLAQGLMDQQGEVFLAQNLIKITNKIGEEPGEILELKKVSLQRLEKMIQSGEIYDASSLLCYYFYKDYINNKKKI